MNTVSLLPSERTTRKARQRHSQRVGELAVLPVFFKLKARKIVLAGGTETAAWKAELLAASGARVHVYAETLSPEFKAIIAAGEPGQYIHHARQWGPDGFEDAELALADAENDDEAKAFFTAARACGLPVNVIDRPAFCSFQFGSIVNRSPAIIAISTDGAAPILGQAIRRRIEVLLPPALQDWARLAAKLRGIINQRLKPGPQRRAFWERFVDRAFARAPDHKAEAALLGDVEMIRTAPSRHGGKVTFVGAGPGDAELLTMKAVRALQAADVILFDDLVSGDVLELARREAKRLLVGEGKECETNEMMISLVKAGKNVVRLKSGNPMTCCQAADEIARLEDRNIAVGLVPGVAMELEATTTAGIGSNGLVGGPSSVNARGQYPAKHMHQTRQH